MNQHDLKSDSYRQMKAFCYRSRISTWIGTNGNLLMVRFAVAPLENRERVHQDQHLSNHLSLNAPPIPHYQHGRIESVNRSWLCDLSLYHKHDMLLRIFFPAFALMYFELSKTNFAKCVASVFNHSFLPIPKKRPTSLSLSIFCFIFDNEPVQCS
jgi:hypothetical protein